MPAYATPEGKYRQQMLQAKQRGIPWEFTFEQWWAVWQDSGKWEQRGKKLGQYVMARHGDVGPYSTSNVYICLATKNIDDARKNGRFPGRVFGAVKQAKPAKVHRGWTYVRLATKRPYQVTFRNKYIGSYATQAEAEAVYLQLVGNAHSSSPVEANAPFFVRR